MNCAKKQEYSSDPFTYLALQAIIQYMGIDKRNDMSKSSSVFRQFDGETPYYFRNVKLKKVTGSSKWYFGGDFTQMKCKLDTVKHSYKGIENFIGRLIPRWNPDSYSESERNILEHSKRLLDRRGTIIENLHIRAFSKDVLCERFAPHRIGFMNVEYFSMHTYQPGFLKNFENSKIRKLRIVNLTNDIDLFNELINFNVERLSIFGKRIPDDILWKFLEMKVKVLKFEEFHSSMDRFINVCEFIQNGKFHFAEFVYHAHVSLMEDDAMATWEQYKTGIETKSGKPWKNLPDGFVIEVLFDSKSRVTTDLLLYLDKV